MQSLLADLKVALMRSRLLTLQLQKAHAAAKSGNVMGCELALNEALDTSKSIAAIFLIGSGSGSTTPDTTLEPLMPSGMNGAVRGRRGSSPPESSGSPDGRDGSTLETAIGPS